MDNVSQSQYGRRFRPRSFAVAAAIVFWAFGLQAYMVGAAPWRGDEGFSVTFVAQPLDKLLAGLATIEPNPPLYYFVLKGWMGVAGGSELASRWPSVLAGVTAIALTYRLGRALVTPKAGLIAALLTACNPLLLWHAQDARVYALMTALVLAAVWQTWEAARDGAWRHWLAAGVLWWLALFSHYFAVFPFAAVGLALMLAPRTRRHWRAALMLGLGVGLAQLPWALYVAPFLLGHSKGWIAPTSMTEVLWRTLKAFSVGTATTGSVPATQWLGGWLLALLCAFGGVLMARRKATATIWLAALGLGGPGLLGLLSLFRPVYTEPYVLPALPGVLLLAAMALETGAGARWILRILAGAALAGLALLAWLSVTNIYFNPRYAKSHDWRAVVAYLVQTARPAEVLAMNLPDPAFFLYYHGPMPVEAVPAAPLAQLGVPAAVAQLGRLRDRYQHIRFFNSPSPGYDPDGFAGQWLETCCEKLSDDLVAGLRVQTFDTPSGSLAARQAYPVDFSGGIALTGWRLLKPDIAPGQAAHLTLFWTARQPISQAYTVFIHLLAVDGFDLLDADGPPVNDRRPTDSWQAGETIIDPHLISIPADLPPGDYALEIGLYVRATNTRLSLTSGSGQPADAVRLPVMLQVRVP
jgi:mannosyltransferase